MPTLQDFADDELMRAPLVIEEVIEGLLERRGAQRPVALGRGEDPARLLQRQRGEVVREAMRSLRAQVAAELGSTATTPAPAAPAAAPAAGGPGPAPEPELALLDDEAVAADIGLSRAVETSKAFAEYELRELRAFTSALVGDLEVARDTNPFRPEAWARALWTALQSLPLPRATQAALMQDLAEPLGRQLRQVYAAACTRLEAQKVVPGAYRTIVLSPGHEDTTDLQQLRDSMPLPLDEAAAPAPAARDDARLVELLSRLFKAMLADPRLPPSALGPLSRLHPVALRLARRDPSLLAGFDHALWRFADRIAFLIGVTAPAALPRSLGYLGQLIDQLAGDSEPAAARFEWALSRLAAFEEHGLGRAQQDAAAAIDRLQRLGLAGAPPDDPTLGTASQPMPLDAASLDTVPAALLPDEIDGALVAALDATPAGAWLSAFLDGGWRTVQLLWRSEALGLWLLADPLQRQRFALRRQALDRLALAGLLRPLRPRPLAQDAALQVQRELGPAAG